MEDPEFEADRQNALLTTSLRKNQLADIAQNAPEYVDFEAEDLPELSPDYRRRIRQRIRNRLRNTLLDFTILARTDIPNYVFENLAEDQRSGIVAFFYILMESLGPDEFQELALESFEELAEQKTAQQNEYVVKASFSIESDVETASLDPIRDALERGDTIPPRAAEALYRRDEIDWDELTELVSDKNH